MGAWNCQEQRKRELELQKNLEVFGPSEDEGPCPGTCLEH